MLYQDFIKCLTSGSWMLRGHTYRFLSPALQNAGYFTVDGVSDTELNFEVTFENGVMYLYLNVDRESIPEERYRIHPTYCAEKISMIHEMRKDDMSGYESPSNVAFERSQQVETPPKTQTWKLAGKLRRIWKKASSAFFKEGEFNLGRG